MVSPTTSRYQFSFRTLLAVVLVCCVVAATARIVRNRMDPSYWVHELTHLHGLSEGELLKVLGEPDREDRCDISPRQGFDELRSPLLNTYPPDRTRTADVPIKELTWKKGSFYISIWLHAPKGVWVVLESCRWHQSIQF